MRLAVPKEILANERRVAVTPDGVPQYAKLGFQVFVEQGAGAGIFAGDDAYRDAGATVVSDTVGLFGSADLVLKVKQPELNARLGRHEAEMVRRESTLVTFLHPAAPGSHALIRMLAERRVTAFTMDGIPRTSRAQRMDALTSMSTVTGYKSVLLAACRLPTFVPMTATAVGALKPARVLVVGAGVVGLQALATAKRLGGVVSAVDIRPEAREAAGSLGAKVPAFEVPAELARGAGGYALALPPDWLTKERAALAPLVAESEIVVLSALVPGEQAPVLVTEELVRGMRPGAVIVDVSIDQGGNCALTRPGEEREVHGVTVMGLQNIPGSVAVHSTQLYATNMLEYVRNLYKQPGVPDWDDDIVRSSLVVRDGRIVHAGALKAMEQA